MRMTSRHVRRQDEDEDEDEDDEDEEGMATPDRLQGDVYDIMMM